MTSTQSIKDLFFEECEDLLEALDEGLSEIEMGSSDSDTVNAVFRAVHSVKGGAGAFGLDAVVEFAHSFETVLDKLRSGALEHSSALTPKLLKSGDILSDLVAAARNGDNASSQAADDMATQLAAVLSECSEQTEEESEDLDFEPMGLQIDFGPIETSEASIFEISFTPRAELYEVGLEPLALLKALSSLGDTGVRCDASELPELSDLDSDRAYLAWIIDLETDQNREAIEEIFEFAEGLCELEIEEKSSIGVEAEPEPEADSPVAPPIESAQEPPAQVTPAKREKRDTLRVDVGRIDRLINLVGELIVNQAMIAQRFSELSDQKDDDALGEMEDYKQLARDIQEGVMSLRTQPVQPLFQRMARIVRETAESTGKLVQLKTEGEWTEVDKKVTEKLADPLTHMIRNSIDHGIEQPENRVEAGKSETGTVMLSATHKSGSVLITVSDDGAGLNRQRILSIAIEKGLVKSDAVLTDNEIDALLFCPGFSTAKEVTNLSGRGVGMDVVKTAIESLGGRISIVSTPGKGTTFSIQLPLTLAVMDGMVTRVGEQTIVIPLACILEAIRPTANEINEIEPGRKVLAIRGGYLPILSLSDCLDISSDGRPFEEQVLLILAQDDTPIALAVDAVHDQRQVVIKSLTGHYGDIEGISAATILGDGSVALILDPDSLRETASLSYGALTTAPANREELAFAT